VPNPDCECGEALFIVLVLPKCSEEEWDRVVDEVKGAMESIGMLGLIRKLAVVCEGGSDGG